MTASGAGSSEGGRRRRHWSDEDKARIVAECDAPGSSVSLVARRHDLNTNMLFTWRRQLRERQRGQARSASPGGYCAAGARWGSPAEMPREPQPGLVGNWRLSAALPDPDGVRRFPADHRR